MEDVTEANIKAVGDDVSAGIIVLKNMSIEAVNEIKFFKAPGLDGFPVECVPRWHIRSR